MFKDTMVNMKWTDIRDSAQANAIVLLPMGVIEEHGPHLCLGTDAYIAHIQCLFIKEALKAADREAVIAPPFYWGVCQATRTVVGSFRIRPETATALLFDIISSLAEFGFGNVYGVTGHGDIQHNLAVLAAFREASEKLAVNARYLFPAGVMQHYGLSGDEPYICPLKPQAISVSTSQCPDVHAGDIETAAMHGFYPDLTDIARARSLPPVKLDDDGIMAWMYGGQTKELSPEGYLGSPADYAGVDLQKHFHDVAARVSAAILSSL